MPRKYKEIRDDETDRRKGGVYRQRAISASVKTVSVGEAIHQAITSLGIEDRLKEQRVLTLWAGVVGEKIAAVTTVDTIRRGELFVSVMYDAWRHRLLFERENIRQKLNRAVGGETVRTIRFTK